ncbi:hypothetical protein SAMN02745975_00563 [Geosporobacter subterraneus DSM 17957]|uniref:Uncharacterized protein n=1 Tax=Geosporobacter subterraneus DSM 17957 TaxID=1121919 RepID=A0A1M6DT96_9FIRM|nr:hypothetical protein [Geosporobacter subterraneus]SHI76350.1 hypothetical protein SAMN02745975_00563 [Geosporobacter subterraneus DSM 17957]
MKKQGYVVEVNIPDEEIFRDRLADAVTDIVISRINKLPAEVRMPVYEEVLRKIQDHEKGR